MMGKVYKKNIKKNICTSEYKNGNDIVLYSDQEHECPDGSKIIYAENNEKIVIIQKPLNKSTRVYEFDRYTKKIRVNGLLGTESDKKDMLAIGVYLVKYNSIE